MNISLMPIYSMIAPRIPREPKKIPAVPKVAATVASGDAVLRHELDETPRRYAEDTAKEYSKATAVIYDRRGKLTPL
jgi:hypothetical protein